MISEIFKVSWASLVRSPSGSLLNSPQEAFFSSRAIAEDFKYKKESAMRELLLHNVLSVRLSVVSLQDAPLGDPARVVSIGKNKNPLGGLP